MKFLNFSIFVLITLVADVNDANIFYCTLGVNFYGNGAKLKDSCIQPVLQPHVNSTKLAASCV